MEEYFQSDSEGYVVKDFDKVVRWEGIGNCQHGYLEESDFGDYVTHEDYEILLEAYKELKHQMESLEK